MMWFVLALLSAVFSALHNTLRKHALKMVNEYMVSFSFRVICVLFMIPLLFIFPFPEIGEPFFSALLIQAILVSVLTILHSKALMHSDLSVTMPMIAFTPLFVTLFSPFMVGEVPTWLGMSGISLIVLGSYMLNIKSARGGLSKPFRELFRERGPQLMLIVSFIWGFTATVDKIGVTSSSPVLWAVCVNGLSGLIILPMTIRKTPNSYAVFRKNLKPLIPVGLMAALTFLAQYSALELTLVANVISIKRLSILFTVLLGYVFFSEKNIKQRFLGAAIMVAGMVLITLFG